MEAAAVRMDGAAISTSDDALVAASRAGDHGAYRELYERHVGRLYAFLLRMTGDRELAGGLVQDSFVKAWERLDQFGGHSRFATWLTSIAINEFRMARRARERRDLHRVDCPDPTALEARAAGCTREELMDLERAIVGLPARARMVLVLATLGDFRHGEIAEMMGISPGTCKAQLHRARKLLQRRLAP